MRTRFSVISLFLCTATSLYSAQMLVHLSWGHGRSTQSAYYVRVEPQSTGVSISNVVGEGFERGEGLKDGAWQSNAGAGDIDGIRFELHYPDQPPTQLQNLQIIWADLLANSDADTARRLGDDPAFHPNASKL